MKYTRNCCADEPGGRKVVLFSHNSNLSGAPISLALLAKKLPSHGFPPLFLIPHKGPLEEILKEWKIDYLVLGHGGKVFELIKILVREKPLLVHVNSLVATWPVILCRILQKPVVWHVREHMGNKRLYARVIHFLATRVVVISHSQLKLFNGLKNVSLVPNAVDFSMFEGAVPSSALSRAGKCIVTYIGSIEPRKGLLVLARAASELTSCPWIHFFVVGENAPGNERYNQQLCQYIREHGLEERFHFLGYRRDIPQILAASDILCHPAYIEAFGRVVIEAMASGKPVIAARTGEMSRIVDEGKSGLLFSPGDHKALARAILELAKNKQLRRKMGDLGYQKAEKVYAIDIHARKMAGVYNEIIEARKKISDI